MSRRRLPAVVASIPKATKAYVLMMLVVGALLGALAAYSENRDAQIALVIGAAVVGIYAGFLVFRARSRQ